MRKITNKARKIYEATKRDCRNHVRNWGYNLETDGGFTGCSTEECVYGRVYNDMIDANVVLEGEAKAVIRKWNI